MKIMVKKVWSYVHNIDTIYCLNEKGDDKKRLAAAFFSTFIYSISD